MIVGRRIEDLTRRNILAAIAAQTAQGVDFFTIHAGIRRRDLPLAASSMGILAIGHSPIWVQA